jgi:DNA primase
MAIERMEFVEAMKHLADRSNMPLPDDSSTDTAEYQRKKDQKQQLYDMNKECARYYHQVLFGDEGKDALAYLTSRGFDIRLIRSFGLGYAPNRWEGARQYLKAKGYDDEQMLQAGITVENKDKGSIYDRFRNRVIFPIINTRGLVLGFGGRVMDDSLPKYLNSSDGPTFNKSLNLFGLNLAAKVRPLEYLIITEGYMDVMSLHQFGFPQAVASLGTSLTPEQARLMRRYAADVYIAYDGDEAGQKATLRALDILKEAGCRARVIQFPDKMDPDEVLKQFGPEYFKKLMDRSLSHVDYKFERLREQHDLTTMDGKVNFATDASEVLAKIDNPIERDAHVQELESLLGIKSRAIYDQINRIQAAGMKQKRVQRNIVGNNRNANDKRRVRILQSSHIKAEAHLINLMVQGADMARKIINGLGDLTLQDPLHRQVVDIVRSLLERGRDVSEAQILSHLQDRDQVKKLVDIFHQEMEYDNIDNFISDCLNQVEKNALEKHRQELQNEITVMDQEGIPDPEKYKELLKELQQLNYRLRADLLERRELREKRRV